MKVLITGITGFLGRYVAKCLSSSHEIIGVSRQDSFEENSFKVFATDYSVESLKQIARGCDAIVHLAASRLNNSDLHQLQNNVNLDFNIFNAAFELGIKNIVFMSTRGVYGSIPGPWFESGPVSPDNFYSLAKRQSECIAEFYITRGLNVKILRAAQVLGVGEYEGSAVSRFIKSAVSNQEITVSVEGIEREYIYVKDLSLAVLSALETDSKSGIYNVGGGETVTLTHLARVISTTFSGADRVIENYNKKVFEYSLMDSNLFIQNFNWKPVFTFESAVRDMKFDIDSGRVNIL